MSVSDDAYKAGREGRDNSYSGKSYNDYQDSQREYNRGQEDKAKADARMKSYTDFYKPKENGNQTAYPSGDSTGFKAWILLSIIGAGLYYASVDFGPVGKFVCKLLAGIMIFWPVLFLIGRINFRPVIRKKDSKYKVHPYVAPVLTVIMIILIVLVIIKIYTHAKLVGAI